MATWASNLVNPVDIVEKYLLVIHLNSFYIYTVVVLSIFYDGISYFLFCIKQMRNVISFHFWFNGNSTLYDKCTLSFITYLVDRNT